EVTVPISSDYTIESLIVTPFSGSYRAYESPSGFNLDSPLDVQNGDSLIVNYSFNFVIPKSQADLGPDSPALVLLDSGEMIFELKDIDGNVVGTESVGYELFHSGWMGNEARTSAAKTPEALIPRMPGIGIHSSDTGLGQEGRVLLSSGGPFTPLTDLVGVVDGRKFRRGVAPKFRDRTYFERMDETGGRRTRAIGKTENTSIISLKVPASLASYSFSALLLPTLMGAVGVTQDPSSMVAGGKTPADLLAALAGDPFLLNKGFGMFMFDREISVPEGHSFSLWHVFGKRFPTPPEWEAVYGAPLPEHEDIVPPKGFKWVPLPGVQGDAGDVSSWHVPGQPSVPALSPSSLSEVEARNGHVFQWASSSVREATASVPLSGVEGKRFFFSFAVRSPSNDVLSQDYYMTLTARDSGGASLGEFRSPIMGHEDAVTFIIEGEFPVGTTEMALDMGSSAVRDGNFRIRDIELWVEGDQ